MHINTDSSSIAVSNLDATRMASELQDALDCGEDSMEVLTEFHAQMAGYESKSYAVISVAGRGTFAEAFVWWMDDQSALVVGWQDEETLVVGVLPPGAQFAPLPYYDGSVITLH